MKKTLVWGTALLVPLALTTLALRLMLTPLFLQIEYRMPWFPPDPYGMTQAERLHWAPYTLRYLTSNADIAYLQNLRFYKVADACFCHYGDGNGRYNFLNHARIGHASHATIGANVGGDAL